MKILVTGGCGFIGSNFIRHVLRTYADYEIINLDALTYAGNPYNLSDIVKDERYTFVEGRVENQELVARIMRTVDWVVNFAAESHVDRSIVNAVPFLQTNVIGLQCLLDAAKKSDVERFLHISTDEVYGSLETEEGIFTEETPLAPNSPYAASKAAGDLLIRAHRKTFNFPVIIARPTNNYGPYQFPEKFIPLMITNLIDDRRVPVYGQGLNIRDWLYVEDAARGLDTILHKGKAGETYNIGGESEVRNIELVESVLAILGKGREMMEFVTDRPGHDFRYALDNAKIRAQLGWKPDVNFREGLERTVRWFQENEWWWRPLKARLTAASRGFWQ